MKPRWTVSIDLDGVLCKPTSSDKYATATPIKENIEKVNTLFHRGWRVIINTARGWYLYDLTEEWLRRNGVAYSELVMGKLFAMAYIDDMNSTLDEVLEKKIN